MTQTKHGTSPHLRPHTADLNRLLAGEHHDPHSVLGAHEYSDHTVIRAYRPHAVEVTAIVGQDRYPFSHIEAGLFAVALPFTDLVDYRRIADDTLLRLQQQSVVMERFGPLPGTPVAECERLAASSDVVVCIVAHRLRI